MVGGRTDMNDGAAAQPNRCLCTPWARATGAIAQGPQIPGAPDLCTAYEQ
jgi:hypothetical protein